MDPIIGIFLPIAVLIFSVIIHEVSHGLAAYQLGDPTAKYAGRLTLNPISHMDLWGSFIVPLFLAISNLGIIFGWAKPVPYNPYNLKDQRFGPAIVGVAGPMSNLALVLLSGVFLRALLVAGTADGLLAHALALVFIINIALMVFNLFPIPPLDGSKLLFAFLPISEYTKQTLEKNGLVILLVFLFLAQGVISVAIYSVAGFLSRYVIGVGLGDLLNF
jgi:Zn-dependent protease